MVTHNSLSALEDAQDYESAGARQRIEQAEEYVAHYRSQLNHVQESFCQLAAREGILDDPGFRRELQRVADEMDENVYEADQLIAELDADFQTMAAQHREERELFIEAQRTL